MSAGLIADIGGTHARFAVVDDAGVVAAERTLLCADHAHIEDALAAYRSMIGMAVLPQRGAMCAAGPVKDGKVKITNNPWLISTRDLPFDEVLLLNDFDAIAHALPALEDDDVVVIRPGVIDPQKPLLAIGPGTGLGVAALLPGGAVVPSEAGHMALATRDAGEDKLVQMLRGELDFVSVESVLSGCGLEAVYRLNHPTGDTASAAEITERAMIGSDDIAGRTLDQFFCILGRSAGDLMLALGAQGGLFLAGGILPRVQSLLLRSSFLDALNDKGRFAEYVATVPVRLITHPYPAFVGLAHLLSDRNQ